MSTEHIVRNKLIERKTEITDRVMNTLWEEHPEYDRKFDAEAKEKCRGDIEYHILYLADAVGTGSYPLFENYIGWVKVLFASIGVPNDSFLESLKVINSAVDKTLEEEEVKEVASFLERSIREFPEMPTSHPSAIGPGNPLHKTANLYLSSLLEGDREKAASLVFDELEKGTSVKDIYLHVFQAVQKETGRLWQMNHVSVAQEHFCTAATQLIMSRLYPYIFNREKNGHVFIGACVGDELHELGVRMIADFFELDGWDTFFLGANTPVEAFLQAIKEHTPDVVGIGVTITYNINKVREIIQAIRDDSATREVKILVGGYPFNLDTELWKKVGADGFAENALGAVEEGNRLAETE